MKGAEARARGEVRRFERLALNAAFQIAALTRVRDMDRQMQRFEQAIGATAPRAVADKLADLAARGVPMRVTIVDREA